MGVLLSKKQPFKFNIGDICRILKTKSVFKSSSYEGRFSTVLYKIIARKINFGLPVYYLEEALSGTPLNGAFQEFELRKVAIKANALPSVFKVLDTRLDKGVENVKIKATAFSKPTWVVYTDLLKQLEPK